MKFFRFPAIIRDLLCGNPQDIFRLPIFSVSLVFRHFKCWKVCLCATGKVFDEDAIIIGRFRQFQIQHKAADEGTRQAILSLDWSLSAPAAFCL